MVGRSCDSRKLARRPPSSENRGKPLSVVADAMHASARRAQMNAGAAGVATNRVLAQVGKPLKKGGLKRAHTAGTNAARGASESVAAATNGARVAVNTVADGVVRATGGSSGVRAMANMATGVFESAAAAPVFLAQALHTGYADAQVATPHYVKPPKPQNPHIIKPPYCKPPKPLKPPPGHLPGNVKPTLDPNGKPYKPPPGYPAARRRASSSRKRK